MKNMFLEAFKTEHSLILDDLLTLQSRISDDETTELSQLLERLDEIMGIHFLVEEKALYPTLCEYLSEDYVQKLIKEHDLALHFLVNTKKSIKSISSGITKIGPDIELLLQQLITHVISCDGLSLVVQKLPESKIDELNTKMHYLWEEAKPLTKWRTTRK